jgi:hypothetical protein
MSYKETLKIIKQRQSSEFNGIPTKFLTLGKVLPTWDKTDSIIVSSATGVGKTSFVWKHAVLDVVDFLKNNPNFDAKIFYLSLELTRHELYIKLFIGLLDKKFNKKFTRAYVMGYEETRITDEEFYFLEDNCKKMLDFLDNKVEIIDTSTSPTKLAIQLSTLIPNVEDQNSNMYYFVITDTTNALSADPGETKMASLKKWNQDLALKIFRNQKNCIVINIQQQDKSSSQRQYTFKGDTVEDKYVPTLEALGGDKEASNSSRLVLSLFNPQTYGIREWGYSKVKYNVNQFLGGLRFIYVNKNNFGDNDLVIPYYYNGALNEWTEIIEEAEDFRSNPKLYKKYTGNTQNLMLFS